MIPEQQLAIRALENMRGDDLFRARRTFNPYTQAQMDAPYGASEKTPRQILAEYEASDTAVSNAIAWVKSK